jgi:tRNA G10  N-methylase Trm11
MVQRQINVETIYGLFKSKITSMIEDIAGYNQPLNKVTVSANARIGDARRLPISREFDAIITSPPYPNRHDYTRIYELEMAFDFLFSNNELKNIRYETIRSHVVAKKKYDAQNYVQAEVITDLIHQINANGTNNPQIINMLQGYFEDMYLALLEVYRCLKPDGKAAFVVSNVRYAGINVPVDEILRWTPLVRQDRDRIK